MNWAWSPDGGAKTATELQSIQLLDEELMPDESVPELSDFYAEDDPDGTRGAAQSAYLAALRRHENRKGVIANYRPILGTAVRAARNAAISVIESDAIPGTHAFVQAQGNLDTGVIQITIARFEE